MIKKITPEEFYEIARKSPYTLVCRDIDEFLKSEDSVCEVDVSAYTTANSAAGSYRNAAKRMKYDLDVMIRNGRCFMVKTEGAK